LGSNDLAAKPPSLRRSQEERKNHGPEEYSSSKNGQTPFRRFHGKSGETATHLTNRIRPNTSHTETRLSELRPEFVNFPGWPRAGGRGERRDCFAGESGAGAPLLK
uniref:Uncharacterized protein n=1 Tax=Laticauda laticaudata TaxID=8630 RepID=A0A8C5SX96_LATLA